MKKQGPAFNVPVLPHTAPEAEQPHGLKLPLMPHQLRALNRCLVIEQDGSVLNQDFGSRYDSTSRGGCLSDSVGTGKTATSIGLVLSGKEEQDKEQRGGGTGGTLVVAPAHLIPQWKHEIQKFAGDDSIQVLVGKEEHYRSGQQELPLHCTRRIVLIAVDDVLNEPKLWYDWRRVFTKEPGKKGKGGGRQIKVRTEKWKSIGKQHSSVSNLKDLAHTLAGCIRDCYTCLTNHGDV
jgi:SNF2 family DNA or RNA helicase